MLVVRVELWPGGFESGKRQIALMRIYNDGTGDDERGNYIVQQLSYGDDPVTGKLPLSEGVVKDHNRACSVWELVRKALNAKWAAPLGLASNIAKE